MLEIAGGVRSVSQKIFIILIKLLEALSDKDLNSRIDDIINNRISTFKKVDNQMQMEKNESMGIAVGSPDEFKESVPGKFEMSNQPGDANFNQSSVTLTITKMILFNLDKLLQISKKVQDSFTAEK